jgi:hypothetical protein
MENLYYNLSEEEFSPSRKILLWGFAGFFFLGGVYVLMTNLVFGHKSIPLVLSVAPFGISLVVSVIAAFATIRRKDLFFSIDDEKIEFRYGIYRPKKHSYQWSEINQLVIPHKQKKAKLMFRDGSSYVINLTWIQNKKSGIIRKHIYQTAASKDLKIVKVAQLNE